MAGREKLIQGAPPPPLACTSLYFGRIFLMQDTTVNFKKNFKMLSPPPPDLTGAQAINFLRVLDQGPTLYKCHRPTNVLCLLGYHPLSPRYLGSRPEKVEVNFTI